MELSNECLKRALFIRKELSSEQRRYSISQEIMDSLQKSYKPFSKDLKYTYLAEDSIGTLTDCYIMYAIAVLRIAEIETLQRFLTCLIKRNPHLVILDPNEYESFKRRLKTLHNCGMLFKHMYRKKINGKEDCPVTLYSLDSETQELMNQALSMRTKNYPWLQVKPIIELLGMASCSTVTVALMQEKGFLKYLPAIYKTRDIGTFILPSELQFQKESQLFNVGIIPSYLYHLETVQALDAYLENCLFRIKMISNFLFIAEKQYNSCSRVVCVVESNDDLMNICKKILNLILANSVPESILQNIYFVGEYLGEMNFLQMYISSDKECDFIAVTPDFL